MTLVEKINFWSLRLSRMFYYNIKYRINKWINLEGIEFPVHLDYGYAVLRFIDNKQYESGEINIIKNTLTNDDVVLELGTGLGFVSAYCAKKIGSEKVFTFEANAALQPNIEELYSRNKVSPNLKFAILGNQNGNISFYQNKDSLLASGLNDKRIERKQKVQVQQKNLNEEIRKIRPSYLIMDIEGGEYDIFKHIDFQSIRKIQFELHPDVLDTAQIKEIFSKLSAHDFKQEHALDGRNYFFKR